MLDGPVSGEDVGARDGTLSIMVGGEEDDFERARPLFEAMGETVVHVGGAGAGQVVKACNQIVVALVIEAVAEALVLGSKAGVAPHKVVEVLAGGLAANKVLEVKGEKFLSHDFTPGGKVEYHRKEGLWSSFFGQDFLGPAQGRVGSRETDGGESEDDGMQDLRLRDPDTEQLAHVRSHAALRLGANGYTELDQAAFPLT
jgi:NAD-binding of NADP-dependent 3-hydroxyisobutyrate dehydrogenase/NAD binding domain of 6-phosphogluconate dehydrogenase